MSTTTPREPARPAIVTTAADSIATFLADREGEDGMGLRSVTIERFEEIRRRLADGRGIREIARALDCSRDTVREVRDGLRQSPAAPRIGKDPLWMRQIDWATVVHELGLGHPLKLILPRKIGHSSKRPVAARTLLG